MGVKKALLAAAAVFALTFAFAAGCVGDKGRGAAGGGPAFSGLAWMDVVGGVADSALVGDDVRLFCEAQNIRNGKKVRAAVYEYGDDGEHYLVASLVG